MRMLLFSLLGRKTRRPHHRLSSSILLLRCCWLVEHGCCLTTPTPTRMSSHSLVANIDNSSSRKKPKRTMRTIASSSVDAHANTHGTAVGIDPLLTIIPQSVCEELLIGPAAATLATTGSATVVSAADVIDTMKFAYPYWYDPHPLVKWAAQQVQHDLSLQHVLDKDEDDDDDEAENKSTRKNRPRSGQMYGALVVSILDDSDQDTHQPPQEQKPKLKFGYLKAYTGRTNKFKPRTGTTGPGRFVPLLYDRYSKSNTSSFCYTTELKKLHDLAQQIERMKNEKDEEDDDQKKYDDQKKDDVDGSNKKYNTNLKELTKQTDRQLQEMKIKHKRQKQIRKDRRDGLQQQLVMQQHQPNPNAEGTAILRNNPKLGTTKTKKAWHKYLLETTQNVQYCALEDELVHASAVDQRELKRLKHHIHTLLQPLQQKEHDYHQTMREIEDRLKRETQQLQRTVYQQYKLWNFQTGTTNNNTIKTITQLFANHKITPIPLDGCGDCSSIKLFQYAFRQRHTITNQIHPKKQLVVQPQHSGTNTTGSHVTDHTTTHDADRKRTRETENDYTRYHYRPIALAEFWWGKSPHASGNHPATSTQAARHHQYYYPICRGLNEPLLSGHVLVPQQHEQPPGTPSDTRCAGRPIGIQVEKNPMYTNNNPTTTEDDNTDDSSRSISIPPLDIVYEDEYMLIINKAHNVLSVPGPTIDTSIELQIRDKVRVALPPLPVPSLDQQQQQKQPPSPAPRNCDDAVDDGSTRNNQNSHRKSNRRKKNKKNKHNTQASVTTDIPASSDYKGPYLVHRLDYSTSGLLLAAKDANTHKNLQSQFMKRTTKKRYEALLVGDPFRLLVNDDVREDATTTNSYSDNNENDNDSNNNNQQQEQQQEKSMVTIRRGTIDMPLAGDYINRPMQKVDYSSDGKSAVTKYEVIGVEQHNDDNDADDHPNGDEGCSGTTTTRTRIYLYPVTGRTHQLRVHASHPDGPIKSPIVGDDIYGQRNNSRLCLHAGFLEINHPKTGNRISFTAAVPF